MNVTIKGKLFVISGPSGAGKSTLAARLFKEVPDIVKSISATTRQSRDGEVHGSDYYFLTVEDFKKNIDQDWFAEWCLVYGNYYGTPAALLKDSLVAGNDIMLEIDVQGAMKIKKLFPESIRIFVKAPSIEVYRQRLHERGKDSEDVINKRISVAEEEIALMKSYDHEVINDNLDDAYRDLKSYVEEKKTKK